MPSPPAHGGSALPVRPVLMRPTLEEDEMTTNVQKKVVELRTELDARFLERSEEIDALLAGMLSNEHVVLLGKAGVAKSAILRAMRDGIGITDSEYFEVMMSKFTTPNEFLGPYKMSGLKKDQYVRMWAGMLPEAKLAFLDEVFKSNSAALNVLLPLMNERVVHQEGKSHPIPLRMLVGASNEMPEGDAREALWDRFLIRMVVKPLHDDRSRAELLKRARNGGSGVAPMRVCMSERDLIQAQEEAANVEIDDGIISMAVELRRQLEQSNIEFGDRRWFKCMRILQAFAYIDGSETVEDSHFEILRSCLWATPEHIPTVNQVVAKVGSPIVMECRELMEACMEKIGPMLDSGSGDDLYKALGLMHDCGKRMKQKVANEPKGGRVAKRVEKDIDALRAVYNNTKEEMQRRFDVDGEAAL